MPNLHRVKMSQNCFVKLKSPVLTVYIVQQYSYV